MRQKTENWTPGKPLIFCADCGYCPCSGTIYQHTLFLHSDAQHFSAFTKNTVKLESLLLIGYSPSRVALPYQILTLGLNVVVLLLSVGIVSWARTSYLTTLNLLFPQMSVGSLWPTFAIGIVFILIGVFHQRYYTGKRRCCQYGYTKHRRD